MRHGIEGQLHKTFHSANAPIRGEFRRTKECEEVSQDPNALLSDVNSHTLEDGLTYNHLSLHLCSQGSGEQYQRNSQASAWPHIIQEEKLSL